MSAPSASLARRRGELYRLFALPGLAIASWVTRTPDIRDAVHASTAEMGVILLGLSLGAMFGILAAPRLIAAGGTRAVIAGALAGVMVSMPVIGLGAHGGVAALVFTGLALFGAGLGLLDIAVNLEGVALEEGLGRPVLPALHGCFSLGTVVGGAVGVLASAAHVVPAAHLVAIGVVGSPTLAGELRGLRRPGVVTAGPPVAEGSPRPRQSRPWSDRRLLVVAAVAVAIYLAEGAANDWLPLVMVDGHGAGPVFGAAVYLGFASAMTAGRFGGGLVLRRRSPVQVVRASALVALAGIGVVALVDSQVAALVAVVLWGLGVSLGAPLTMAAASAAGPGEKPGESAAEAARRVSFVSATGYLAFLVGPPALGVIGEDLGLRAALMVPFVLVASVVLLAPRMAGAGMPSAAMIGADAGP